MGESEKKSSVSIGFVGCGTIASAIVTGLAKSQQIPTNGAKVKVDPNMPTISSISLSKRSEKKSSALKEAFPDLVTVHEDNQEILDRSDIVFLCVLNDQTATVLEPLQFDAKGHTLVSLVVRWKCFFFPSRISVCSINFLLTLNLKSRSYFHFPFRHRRLAK